MRTIKISTKKIIMRPENKSKGLTEIWGPNQDTVNILPLQYITFKGITYYLQATMEKV